MTNYNKDTKELVINEKIVKTLSFVLSVCMIVSLLGICASAEDVNGDGAVNMKDVLKLCKMVSGIE